MQTPESRVPDEALGTGCQPSRMVVEHIDEHTAVAQPDDAVDIDHTDQQQAEGERALPEESGFAGARLSHGCEKSWSVWGSEFGPPQGGFVKPQKEGAHQGEVEQMSQADNARHKRLVVWQN